MARHPGASGGEGGEAPRAEREAARIEEARAEAGLTLRKARARLERRIAAIGRDLARGAEAEERARHARWFVAAASRARRGTRELTATDWSTGEAVTLTLPIDPAKEPQAEVEAIFNEARRMQRGQAVAEARLADARGALARVTDAAAQLDAASSLEEIDAARAAAGLRPPAAGKPSAPRSKQPAERKPFRTFKAGDGTTVYVGKGAADNDALTFKVARPYHLWLHARGTQGAHVVLLTGKGKAPVPDALVDAAHLAAHFSGYRGEATVEVDYVLRGHVRKPRGSPPGLVVVDGAKTINVRIEPARLQRLLASEEV